MYKPKRQWWKAGCKDSTFKLTTSTYVLEDSFTGTIAPDTYPHCELQTKQVSSFTPGDFNSNQLIQTEKNSVKLEHQDEYDFIIVENEDLHVHNNNEVYLSRPLLNDSKNYSVTDSSANQDLSDLLKFRNNSVNYNSFNYLSKEAKQNHQNNGSMLDHTYIKKNETNPCGNSHLQENDWKLKNMRKCSVILNDIKNMSLNEKTAKLNQADTEVKSTDMDLPLVLEVECIDSDSNSDVQFVNSSADNCGESLAGTENTNDVDKTGTNYAAKYDEEEETEEASRKQDSDPDYNPYEDSAKRKKTASDVSSDSCSDDDDSEEEEAEEASRQGKGRKQDSDPDYNPYEDSAKRKKPASDVSSDSCGEDDDDDSEEGNGASKKRHSNFIDIIEIVRPPVNGDFLKGLYMKQLAAFGEFPDSKQHSTNNTTEDLIISNPNIYSVKKHVYRIKRQRRTPSTDSGGLYRCKVCKRTCSQWDSARSHAHKHFECYVACHICGKVLKKSALKAHIEVLHTLTDKSCKCSVVNCQYASKTMRELICHERTHTAKRIHTCEICGKAFRRRDNLVVHLRIHEDDNPILCFLCGYRCRQKAALNWHMKTKHHDDDTKKELKLELVNKAK